MFRKLTLATLVCVALTLLIAAPASAGENALGQLRDPAADPGDFGSDADLGQYHFVAKDEKLDVTDEKADGWSILVELWWGGKLRRVCWDNTLGSGNGFEASTCDFEIRDGTRITFFIAEARKRLWNRCWDREHGAWVAPDGGCGKRTGYWVGPGRGSEWGIADPGVA